MAMKQLLESLPSPKQTIFLVLDDINGLARSEAFANWLKRSVDEFATTAPEAGLCILVVGTAEVIGSKLLEPSVFKAIQSERYRSILRQLAHRPRKRFKRSEVLERLTSEDRPALDNFLRRMKNLGAIERDPEIRGGYRFPNRLHPLYFFMESRRHLRIRDR